MADHSAADFDNRHDEIVDAALHEGAIVHTKDGTALADSDQRNILLGNITVDDFVEVARPAAPLYVETVSALADGVLTGSEPQRRAVRRSEEYDRINPDEEEEFDTNSVETPRHRRAPNGTVHQ